MHKEILGWDWGGGGKGGSLALSGFTLCCHVATFGIFFFFTSLSYAEVNKNSSTVPSAGNESLPVAIYTAHDMTLAALKLTRFVVFFD